VESGNRGSSVSFVGAAGYAALLVKHGLVSQQDLSAAEQQAERDQTPLAEVVSSSGLAPEEPVFDLLAEAAGLGRVDLSEVTSSELAIRLVPEKLARRLMAVPLHVDNRVLTYATCRPFTLDADRDLGFASGRRTRAVIASLSQLRHALDAAYPKMRELDVLAARLSTERPKVALEEKPAAAATESTVIDMCNHIVGRAVEVGASDIHIEAGNEGAAIQYRICGVLEPVLTLPASVSQPIRNRFKIMGRVGVAVRHRAQEGSFRMKVNERPVDVRLSTLPTVNGEKIVLRVVDSQSPLQTIASLNYDADTTARLAEALTRPDGLVLVTGPSGCGKTTTLYAALGDLCGGGKNVVTVEDPVERKIPGITQIPVNAPAGNSFPTVLRSLLRQDPNVVMVGEIRDEEVAQLVGQAAFTGHLVLSSMHTGDAAAAITRLTNLGLEPFKVADCLSAVVSQRLVRTLCAHCQRKHSPFEARRLGTMHGLASVPATAGPGCDKCKHTGYSGRVPVAELLTPSDALREAIARGASTQDLRAAMRASGFATMRDVALRLAGEGITSIEEINRVLPVEGVAKPVRSNAPRVLVTDDEPITRMLVKLLLEREHFEVLEAVNGRQAIEMASRERPDLMLIDLNMPEVDGYEAIARLRRDFSLATLPIIVLTAEEGDGVERRVLQLGADDYIVKPFDPAVLLSRVNAVFRRIKVMAAA
jgi:type II secretory ATPase GspE/PulE/Tfp pilus assembly ATPase PilB-like protein/ActR/RegA family two-component response regulator